MRNFKTVLLWLLFLSVLAPDLSANVNPHGDMKLNCDACHTAAGWKVLKKTLDFAHAETGFPLSGAHKDTDCRKCHVDLKFANIAIECVDCHTDLHREQFGIDCQNCHTPTDWQDREDILETHAKRGFPLVGVHVVVDCDACHIAQGREEFTETPVECEGCHIDNFNKTTDPNHALAGFSQNCEECHPTVSSRWSQAVFQHSGSFALRGAHAGLDCANCHAEMFAGTSQLCFSCHENDYNGVETPSHTLLGFPTECQTCHNDVAWAGAQFDHVDASGFELVGIHATLGCMDCHVNNQFDLPRECIGCHQNDYNSVNDPNHVNGSFPEDCTQCHTQTGWSPATFDHNLTAFPLTGAHTSLDCAGCHINGQFSGTPSDCWSCHQNDYDGVSDPNHVQNNFSQDCTECHSTSGWSPSTFNHSQTQFPLSGAHTSLNCIECHSQGYAGTPTDCWSCHEEDYNGVSDPNHVQNNFSQDCTECHNTNGWSPSTFNHSQTQFPLTGAHTSLNCIECHSEGYPGTPTDCWSCHEDDYNGVSDPNHVQNNFSQDCTECHSTAGWSPSTFNHSQTQFPLTGAHTSLNCIECHSDGYVGTPTDCVACHEDNYNNTTDPNHQDAGFPTTCEVCHSTTSWAPAEFNHNLTQFPLTGAHTTLECLACHADGYTGTPTDCWSCHQDDYNGVTDPNHVENNFNQDCTECHTTNGWSPAMFDHTQTQFPLTGAHTTLACIECHANGYSGTPTDCWSCHEDDYNGVTDPNHVQNNFSQECTQCHSTNGWSPSTFDHNQTQFPLTGAHTTLACIECHADGYSGTPTDCWSCHEDDYNGVIDPNHVQNNFSQDCTQCHSTNGWSPATFDHNQTQFPLTGAHTSLPCIDCHADGYSGTPTDCWSCHQEDYNGVTDPNHVAGNYNHDCTECHTTSGWTPVNFDHNQTQFPLTGTHLTLACLACHSTGYDNTPTACFACHADDYNNTTDPNHQAIGFPTTCEDCHNTINWEQTTWDHDNQYFPIFSGRHQGRWNLCADCHVDPNNYEVFECIFCHDHNQQDMDEKHAAVPGYVYQSSACYSCHPDGE